MDQCQKAFELIKLRLTTAILAHWDPVLPVKLRTDASLLGLGGILLQQHGDVWRVVSYTSRGLSDTETRYGVTDLEALAVVWRLIRWREYLYGHPDRLVETDHCALCYLMKSTGKMQGRSAC